MTAYYNEFDPFAAAWLRALITEGHIAPGDVDERSVDEVLPDDLVGYTQCHFFAGIGGWSLALRLAGWPDDEPVWTGSCPCQPFSVAGKRAGTADKRHLWPGFGRLIAKRKPATVFGEQVASKDGRGWLAGVRLDLENMGYAVGGGDLCAAGVGAPHIRQRLYWVAHNTDVRRRKECEDGIGGVIRDTKERLATGSESSSGIGRLANTGHEPARRPTSTRKEEGGRAFGDAAGYGSDSRMANSECEGLERHAGNVADGREPRWVGAQTTRSVTARGGNRWGDNWIDCGDGKARRIESRLEPLAHGIPNRVGKLRGYGNAIVPALAAEFVMATREVIL